MNTNQKIKKKFFNLILAIYFICLGLYLQPQTTYYALNKSNGAIYHTNICVAEKPAEEGWIVTGYCHCYLCCGEYSFMQNDVIRGASGNELISGYSCAADLPFNTLIKVIFSDGHEEIKRVDDRGVSGKHLDLYYDTHAQALTIGCQPVKIIIY